MGIPATFMRLGWLLLLGCLLAGCKSISTADDTQKLQGTWKLVVATYDGGLQMADMEWIVNGDHYNGGKLKGIYEISGDSLKVCFDLTAQQYPKSFDAKRGSRQLIYEFRRE